MSAILQSGDRVFHPTYGFGVVEGLTTREHEGQMTEYYGIRLAEGKGAVLTVPVARAEAVGLRLIINSLAIVAACLRSPAHPLPVDDRQRVAELRARWQAVEPGAVMQAVRDLLGLGRTRKLTPGDKRWLASACERLSAEAALVDNIDRVEARTAIQHQIEEIQSADK